MPRAVPAVDSAIPKTEPLESLPDPVATQPLPPAEELTAHWGNWLFTDDGPLTYSAIPVTVVRGDVITHFGIPAPDGRWEITGLPANRHPDNHRPESADASKEG